MDSIARSGPTASMFVTAVGSERPAAPLASAWRVWSGGARMSKIFDNYSLEEIAAYIDWQPFFIAWEMHGKFPAILTDSVIGTEATKLYNDAQKLLQQIIYITPITELKVHLN